MGIKGESGKSGSQRLIVKGTEAKGTMRSVPGIQPGAKLLVEMYEIEESHLSQYNSKIKQESRNSQRKMSLPPPMGIGLSNQN